jgi:CRISPR/Cas system-associated endonuclease Cas1
MARALHRRRQGKLGELGAQFTARNAVHPMQAMLNYAIGIATARMTRVVIAKGLDPCFGFLHDGKKPGRLSLVWDCVEPLRPELVRAMFGFAAERAFQKNDFAVFEGGIVRLSTKLAQEVAENVIKKISLIKYMEMVRMVERELRKVKA